MPPDTSMNQVMAHIFNPSCSNSDCPNIDKSTIAKKMQQQASAVGHSNSVWKAELRIRYVPKNTKELYELDRTTCHFFFDQVKLDYIQSNPPTIDQDIAIQLCCLGIRHYYKDTNQTKESDRKQHLDYIEKEVGFSNFIPKSVIETIKQKNLKKLIQSAYKKVYSYTEVEYMMKFFDLLRPQFTFDQEQFIVTLGTGWNIPVDLIIGPDVGISYLPHPQASPIKVTDFTEIEMITTSVLPTSLTKSEQSNSSKSNKSKDSTGSDAKDKEKKAGTCNCAEIKTQLRIRVTGNSEDLAITCNGIKTAESIADLVNGYCRIVKNTEDSFWERTQPISKRTPSSSATNSLEKSSRKMTESQTSANSGGDDSVQLRNGGNCRDQTLPCPPILSEDYADLALQDEEGDYSTPATRNYELDRTQITLSEIIGVGQFGDVHIGTCRIKKNATPLKPVRKPTDANEIDALSYENQEENKSVIHVAVKTCKGDADLATAEKFLEEACK